MPCTIAEAQYPIARLKWRRPLLSQGRIPHASRQALETYSRVALADAQGGYDQVIGGFPV
jgi:hypothetical protein